MNKLFTNLFVVLITLAVLYQSFFNSYVFGRDLPPETVSLSSIAILNKLSKENKYYTISDEVGVESPYYHFFVKAPHGDYNVLSIRGLLKVCHEIRVIEEYRATDDGGDAWDGAGEKLKGIGRGAVSIVKEPKESAKAFARAGGKLMRSIGRFLKKSKDNKASENVYASSKHAREFAAELGLDVYSSNPYVKILVDEVSTRRAKGSLGVSVGLFFLAPIQGFGLLSNALTSNGLDPETETMIRNESPPELKLVLIDKYKKDLGFEYKKKGAVKGLLDNPNYTPRDQAYLNLFFRRLGKPDDRPGVEGLLNAIGHLGKVDTPDAATFATTQVELLSAYHQYAKDLTELVVVSEMLGAITEEKQLFLIIPHDVVGNTTYMQKFLDKVVATSQAHGAKGIRLWFTGDVTGGFVSRSKSMGVKVKENVLLLPHFAPNDTTDQNE